MARHSWESDSDGPEVEGPAHAWEDDEVGDRSSSEGDDTATAGAEFVACCQELLFG